MKTLNKILFGGLTLLGLVSCREYKTEYSDVKHENAIVSSKNYIPSKSKIEVGLILNPTILNPNLTMSGKLGYTFGGFTFAKKNSPAKYEIAFDGKIRFELDDRIMFDRFHSNDQADVSYRELYSLIYDDTNNDGTNELVQRFFMDAEFIDAQPITDRILDRF